MSETSPGVSLDHAPVRVIAPAVFTLDILVGALLGWWRPPPSLGTPARWWVGAALSLPALAMGFWALITMRRAGTSPNPNVPTTAMVETGPFRFTRNPMYASMVLIFAGLAIAFRVTWALVLLPIACVVVDRWVIVPEEHYLAGRFGPGFAAYRARVRRWI